jgi:hypothetical protein
MGARQTKSTEIDHSERFVPIRDCGHNPREFKVMEIEHFTLPLASEYYKYSFHLFLNKCFSIFQSVPYLANTIA